MKFVKAYKTLNTSQKQAVDSIEGPLLVLAGPGTGKTTLLTARIANILIRTDTLAENILCLTFTESAQKMMQKRLVNMIGQDAYKVHIHTFHSFGTWAMHTYPEYFGALPRTKPADDVTRYEIFLKIFEQLSHHDLLSSMNDGEYLYLSDATSRISHLKQAGISPDELLRICREDETWLNSFDEAINKELGSVTSISKKVLINFENLLAAIDINPKSKLGQQAIIELRLAIDEAAKHEQINTKPITVWKNSWLSKTRKGSFIAKYRKDLDKLISLAQIYRDYQAAMQTQALVDYDDMLMRLLEVMAKNFDFLAELQERFIYVMVDEYQDTNGVQDKILEAVASNPVYQNEPNVMIVGDDDQAIYGFQGAYSSNVLDFLKRWPKTTTITLTQNYRSTPEIVNMVRSVIIQGDNRLESHYQYINKQLHTTNDSGSKVRLLKATIHEDARLAVAAAIKQDIDNGTSPDSIAVLSPKHRYLEQLLPYLSALDIEVSYERRRDVLSEPHIYELCVMAKVIVLINSGEHTAASAMLPELLSFPMWGISPKSLWITSLDASKLRQSWLEIMLQSPDVGLVSTAEWLLAQSKQSGTLPLEQMLDSLIGSETEEAVFDSPFRRHYFNPDRPKQQYLDLLSSLITLRDHLRGYQGTDKLRLADFVSYVELRKQANLPIANDHPLSTRKTAVNLMTAYKAKGQEFDTVYLLDGHHSVWGDPRGRKNMIRLNSHIAAMPSGEASDERLRVFYVALTRAANRLIISTNALDSKNNEVLPLGWLENPEVKQQLEQLDLPASTAQQRILAASLEWQNYLLPEGDLSWQDILRDNIDGYNLSPTHMNAFLDVSNGGPKSFLINQLLRFPHALGPSASFGNAMHSLMQWLHNPKVLPAISKSKQFFMSEIQNYHLGEIETSKQQARGERSIDHLYSHKGLLFGPAKKLITERDFASEAVVIGNMRLKGKLDLMAIDEKTKEVIITDYKTGKPAYQWLKKGAKSYEALKLHKYRQQLLFYKLLIDNSRTYGGKLQADTARIVFLEPASDSDDLLTLQLAYDDEELARLIQLMQVVWQKIISLDLPDTSHYSPDITGVKKFENDLLDGAI